MPYNDSGELVRPEAAAGENQRPHKYAFVTPPGSEERFCDFKFLETRYPNPGIEISADRLRANVTPVPGKKIVYFNHKMDVGMGFAMRTLAMSGPRLKYSYIFGATTCTKTTIQANECHVRDLCSEDAVCRGKSVTSELWNCSKTGDFITIIRGLEQFKIEVSNGRSRKEYLKWIPNSRVETLDWYPFIVLDAEVDAVEFITNWRPNGFTPAAPLVRDPRPRISDAGNAGIVEMADNLVSNLEDADPFPALSSAAGDKPHAKTRAPPAPLTPVPAVQVEQHFLPTRYALDNIIIRLESKQAERNSKSGARLVYLSDVFADGTMFSLQVVSDNTFLHQKDHTFKFGLTSCDKKSIGKYEAHAKETCEQGSSCAGHSLDHAISSSAHAGSTVSFQKKSDAVDIKITSSKTGSIEIMRIPENMRGIPLLPFFQLSGNADVIRLSDAGIPAASAEAQSSHSSRPQSQNTMTKATKSPAVLWDRMHSLTMEDNAAGANGDEERADDIKFMPLSYGNNSVRMSNNNRKVRRTAGSTGVPIYFDREIEVGMSVVLEAENAIGLSSGIRFEFGFTSCPVDTICQQQSHAYNVCSRGECTGESHTVGMRYNPSIVSAVVVTRTPEYFAFDLGTGVNHKRFQKHPPDGKRGPDFHWIPFIRLNGDVDAVEITAVTFKQRKYEDFGFGRSPFTSRFGHERSASPANSVTSNRSGYYPHNGRRSSEARITPVRVVNSRPTTKAFGQNDAHIPVTDVTAYRNPQTMGLAAGPAPRPIMEKKTNPSAQAHEQKVIPPAVTRENKAAVPVPRRKWFNNAVVHFNDPVITRVDESADAKSYIFSSKMQLNEKIGFKVVPVSGQKAKLVFGVTTKPLLTVDTGALPIDAAQLHSRDGWFVYEHLATCVSVCDGLAVMRSVSGISLMLPHDPDSGHEIISGIDASATVCPFFQFAGCKLEILYDV